MKVVCVEDNKPNTELEVGNTYTVVRVVKSSLNHWRGNAYYYELQGFYPKAFSTSLFAPISSIDETEMIRNYNTQTA